MQLRRESICVHGDSCPKELSPLITVHLTGDGCTGNRKPSFSMRRGQTTSHRYSRGTFGWQRFSRTARPSILPLSQAAIVHGILLSEVPICFPSGAPLRSEERRVGKECRSR